MADTWKDIVSKSLEKTLTIKRLMSGYFDDMLNLLKIEVDHQKEFTADVFCSFYARMKSIHDEHEQNVKNSEKLFDCWMCDDVFFSMESYIAHLILQKAIPEMSDIQVDTEATWMLEQEYFTKPSSVHFNDKNKVYNIASIQDWYTYLNAECRKKV